jgi:hypothetical protein
MRSQAEAICVARFDSLRTVVDLCNELAKTQIRFTGGLVLPDRRQFKVSGRIAIGPPRGACIDTTIRSVSPKIGAYSALRNADLSAGGPEEIVHEGNPIRAARALDAICQFNRIDTQH